MNPSFFILRSGFIFQINTGRYKKNQLQNKWFEKKGFQEGLQLQNGWFEKKFGAKGQPRLGQAQPPREPNQARPPREPNQAAPAQLAQVTSV